MEKELLYDLYIGLIMRLYRPKKGGLKDLFKKWKFRDKMELAERCKRELDNNFVGPNTIKVFNDVKYIVTKLLPCECDPHFKIYECPKHQTIRFLTKFENLYIGVDNDLFKNIK